MTGGAGLVAVQARAFVALSLKPLEVVSSFGGGGDQVQHSMLVGQQQTGRATSSSWAQFVVSRTSSSAMSYPSTRSFDRSKARTMSRSLVSVMA